MVKKIAVVSIVLLFFGVESFAQIANGSIVDKQAVEVPKHVLKFSFLSLADPSYQSVQFAFEYRLANNLYFQHEVGYIYSINPLSWYQEDFECKGGLRLRNELRSYFNLDRTDKKSKYYFAPEILFIFVSGQNLGFEGVDCANGGCNYYQLQREEDKKYVIGAHFKIGGQRVFNWVALDYYTGLGLRYKWYDSGAEPNIIFGSSDNKIFPSLVLGVKIGWAL